jgi:hypothetical protein
MDWGNAALSLVAAVIGGAIAHHLTLSRDKAAKRREILVRGKTDLWKLIDKSNGVAEDAIGNNSYDLANWEEISRDIQLLGTDEQIVMVKKITDSIGKKAEDVEFPQLMKSLQNELRQELGMEKSSVPYFWIRTKKTSQQKSDGPK